MIEDGPLLIAINPDEYHAEHVGRLADGRQFFLTTPFVPATRDSEGREFAALYLFDSEGKLLDARIDDLGTSCLVGDAQAAPYPKGYLDSLGQYDVGRIEIQPFQVEKFGITFGLIPDPPETADEMLWVEMHPGNYMAFAEPFDSGEYDT